MRLKEIKLAGFKSFVDPTTVSLPGNRSAVVGPNGCGKSNIVDAVRWVMGESSARQLRGEALTDVIFNGSHSRQPTSLASIELLFDNRDGSAGGELGDGRFAAYSEIAVRREVSRDAKSSYFLNGGRCRRRDVADVFLGTGFGPRSYSIIEQGMISQLVEAKPDELRRYLEEAAGTTKYKERRRETCNRIRHTEENLARLNDIRGELEQRLAHLQRQARTAQRFSALKQEERQRTAELLAIRLASVDAQLLAQDAKTSTLERDYEATRGKRQTLDTALEKSRAEHAEQGDAISAAQGRYHALSAEAGRLEQAIEFHRERLRQLDRDQRALADRRAQNSAQIDEDVVRITHTRETIDARKPLLRKAGEADRDAASRLEELEQRLQLRQRAWEEFGNRGRENDSEIRVLQSRIGQGEQMLDRLRARLKKLAAEPAAVADTGIDALARRIDETDRSACALATEAESAGRELTAQRRELGIRERALAASRDEAQRQRRELDALDAVQQAALGRDPNAADAVADWLAGKGLRFAPRLGEHIAVEAGWERAVETVLGDDVQAIVVDAAAAFAGELEQLASGRATLVETGALPVDAGPLPTLASLVRRGEGPVGSLLAGVFAAETVDAALQHRCRLAPGQIIVTRGGLCMGVDWVRLDKGKDAAASVIRRARELERRQTTVAEAEAEFAAQSERVTAIRRRITALEERRESARARHADIAAKLAHLKAEHDVRRVRLDEALARARRSAGEKAEVDAQIEAESGNLQTCRKRLATRNAAATCLRAEGEQLRRDRENDARGVKRAKQLANDARNAHQQLRLECEGLAAKLAASETACDRLRVQQRDLDATAGELRQAVARIEAAAPAQQDALAAKLAERLAYERKLTSLRQRLSVVDADIRTLSARRAQIEQDVDAVRSRLEGARLERERLAAKHDNLQAALAETGIDAATASRGLPDDATEEQWVTTLERLTRRIARLGPINLAAIDEFRTQSERKVYLDRQHDDIQQALATLRGAMERIDSDTKARFKRTFRQVNEQLKTLFPAIFGGGHAYLEMAGDDWLDAGVTLMARPPGKRNSSIQLLSGGEKAMTAVALIFSIFHLNPSPVCLLDEVDAPLDDTNVERFADLIRDMSNDVQFVVITHNKQTIEMADHLLGVTMQEAGVSRLVSVDVEEAARMAAMV